jgi:hypothetical protein
MASIIRRMSILFNSPHLVLLKNLSRSYANCSPAESSRLHTDISAGALSISRQLYCDEADSLFSQTAISTYKLTSVLLKKYVILKK